VEDYSADRNKHKYLQSVLQQSESLVGGDGEYVAASINIGNSMLTLWLYNNIILYLLIPRPLFLLKITNLKKKCECLAPFGCNSSDRGQCVTAYQSSRQSTCLSGSRDDFDSQWYPVGPTQGGAHTGILKFMWKFFLYMVAIGCRKIN